MNKIEEWTIRWRIKVNKTKFAHVTFTTRRKTCPSMKLNGNEISQYDEVKYLEMYLDRCLTWKKHIFSKRKQLSHQLRKMYWLIGRKSQLTLGNKIMLYKCIIKPIWSYGIQLWGTASLSNIEILQRFQSKVLRILADAPWYVTNETLHKDLGITSTVNEEIKKTSEKYKTKLQSHPNRLVSTLMDKPIFNRRLKRKISQDLTL